MLGRRFFLGLLVVLNIVLLYRLIWSEQGVIAYRDLKARHAVLEERVQELDKATMAMSREIRLLKSDRAYLEKMIRQQLNFVKEDEILYVFPERTPEDASGAGSDESKN